MTNPTACKYVDHVDGDKTNNSVENLRWCTNAENLQNKEKSSSNTSGYKGVYLHPQTKKWCVQVTLNGVRHAGGCYSNIVDAAKAYNAKAIELHGAFAKLNLIPDNISD